MLLSLHPAGSGGLAVVSGRLDKPHFVHQRVQCCMPVEAGRLGGGGNRVVPKSGLRQDRGAAVRRRPAQRGFDRRLGCGAQQRGAGDDVARPRLRIEDDRLVY
jgi:hypothetical protein